MNKALHTLKILMRLLAIGFHWHRIKEIYQNQEATIDNIVLLRRRLPPLISGMHHGAKEDGDEGAKAPRKMVNLKGQTQRRWYQRSWRT